MPTFVKEPILPGDGDPRHGTISGYDNHRCRCDLCRAANTRATLQGRERRRLAPDDPRHGSASTYFNYKCRCDACKEAHNEYKRALRQRRKARAVA